MHQQHITFIIGYQLKLSKRLEQHSPVCTKADIAYPIYPLPLDEGEQLLTDAIRQFHAL